MSAQYRIDHWTAENSLPQNSVYAIKKTRDGYLWLATPDGLVRFDGVRFTVFNVGNSPGIESNRFFSLIEDKNGDLWAGTEENGITRLRNGSFQTFTVKDGLNSNNAYLLTTDAEGFPVVQGLDVSFTQFNGEKFVPYQFESKAGKEWKQIKSQYSLCILRTKETRVECFVKGKQIAFDYENSPVGLTHANTRSFLDKNGSFWIVFPNKDLRKVDANGKVTIYDKNNGLPGIALHLVIGDERVSLLSKDEKGALWLNDLDAMKSELLAKNPPESFQDPIYSYEDSEGSIWIGTLRGGLFRFRKQIISTYSKTEGLKNNNIYTVFQDSRGTVWAGADGGLYKYSDGKFEIVKGSENHEVYSIAELTDGRILTGLYSLKDANEGVYEVVENQVKFFVKPEKAITSAIYSEPDGTLWLGLVQKGLVRIKNGQQQLFDEKDGLAAKDVRVIIGDGAGGIWIGSYGGLTHFKDGKFNKWTTNEGLPVQIIRSLYLDADGVLWIGSYDKGLVRFKDGKFIHFTTKSGLFNDGVFQILEDDQRNFWMSSNQGIYRVSKDDLNEFAEGKRNSFNSIAYGKSDGMLNVECNGGRSPAGFKTRDGNLWFPTQDGVAVVSPPKVKVNPNPPPVVIEDFKIDNKTVGVETLFSTIGNAESFIQIQPNQQNFEIDYTALSFINSENIRFKYKLDGLDTDWIDAGTRRTAYFSYIPAGDYTFRVIAANSDGIWNETGQSVQIKVLPPFYQTLWFRVLLVVFIMASAYLFYKRRIVQLEKQRVAQQNFARQLIASQEQERKRIAGELHDGLGQRLVVIKNLAWMFLNAIEKNDQKQIEEISEEATLAIGEVKTISYNLRPYQLDRLGLTNSLRDIIESAQNAADIEFSLEIENIDDYFEKENEINFYRIVQESVNNIVKHSMATKAEIRIKKNENSLETTIKDNGKGFNLSDNPQSAIHNPQSGGFGLIGIKERIDLLGGKFEITASPNQGTLIKIFIKNG